ncbi:PseG/SpsG family protein [Shinella sp. M31]|uniref:PseG/SpsG family protein n=1 Tax=Shinella sp. M31 TaxID=3368615 RepID=UPI003BA0C3A9
MIAFCVDATPHVGMGHLVRCRVLADALLAAGQKAIMYGPARSYRVVEDETRFAAWCERTVDASIAADAAAFTAFAAAHGAKKAVIDDYRANEVFQRVLQDAGIDWLQQFDASREQVFLGRLVVNASPYERPEHYRAVASHPQVEFLLGPRYAILREEFEGIVVPEPNGRTGNIFLSFGGGDDKGAALGVLSALQPIAGPDTRLHLVSGASNPRIAEISARIEREDWKNVVLHVNPPNIPNLMVASDLAILGGGTTTYEAARCGLPMLLLAIAENQVRQSQGWENLGAARYLGRWGDVTPGEIAEAYATLVASTGPAAEMARRGSQLVDCGGTRRLINMLLKGVEE